MLPNRFRRTAPAFILITFYGAVQMIPASVQPAPNLPAQAQAQSPLAPSADIIADVDVIPGHEDALRIFLDAKPH